MSRKTLRGYLEAFAEAALLEGGAESLPQIEELRAVADIARNCRVKPTWTGRRAAGHPGAHEATT